MINIFVIVINTLYKVINTFRIVINTLLIVINSFVIAINTKGNVSSILLEKEYATQKETCY